MGLVQSASQPAGHPASNIPMLLLNETRGKTAVLLTESVNFNVGMHLES